MQIDVVHELDRVINADQHDPFLVLGYHVISRQPDLAIVRAYQPHAESLRFLCGGEKKYMYKMREEGLFEIITNYAEPFSYQFEVTLYNKSILVIDDPYQFLPQIGELDLYLFNQGTHYKIFEKMGAHPCTIGTITGTIFRVWAPNARRVSVVGDFNFWDGRIHQMRILGNSGVWELFIPAVGLGQNYKFEIKTQQGGILEKTDPYQFYAEVRPKSASIVHGLQEFHWEDQQWLDARKALPPYGQPVSIYEVHLGSWQRDPADPERFLSFRELTDKIISYVKQMGFTHLQLMPIMEHPLDESWGYQVTGYFAVTSRFGTPLDFMYFINECHKNGIGVLLDWVPSHFPTDGHSLGRFDGTACYEHDDPRLGTHPEWGTLIFNYGRKEVKSFLIAGALFWFEKFHIDGLRVDAVASMLYLDYARKDGEWLPNVYGGKENIDAIEFLRHLNSIVYERHPDVMMIAEESTSFFGVSKPTDTGGLGFGFKWNMGWMNDGLSFFSKNPIYRKYHHNALTFSLLYAFSENFVLVLSHDEVVHGKRSLIEKMPGDDWQKFANLRLLFLYMFTHPGKKMLFMGCEFGQRREWNCKVSLDWHLTEQNSPHRLVQLFVSELNALYRSCPALHELDLSHEGFRWLDFKDVDHSIVAFARFGTNPENHVVVLLNFTPEVYRDYKLGVPSPLPYREILSSDAQTFGGSGTVNPELMYPIHSPFSEAPFHVIVSVPPLGGIILRPDPSAPKKENKT